MKTFCLVILSIMLCGLSSAQVSRGSATQDICARSGHDVVALPQARTSGQINPAARPPCEVIDMAAFAALNTSELYNHIVSADDPFYCINRIIYTYHSDHSKIIFEDAKVRYIAERAKDVADHYDGENDNGSLGLFVYLSIAGLQATFQPQDVSFSELTWTSIKLACKALATNPNILSESETSLYILGHMMFTASFDNIAADSDILSLAQNMLDNIANNSYVGQANLYPYYYSYYYLLDVFFRYPTDSSNYLNQVVLKKDIITSLGDVATNTALNSETYQYFGDLSIQSVIAITRHAPHGPLQDVVAPALTKVTETYEEYTSNWFSAATSLIRNDLGFERTEEELRSELEGITFPNNFHFEDGRIQIATSLDYGAAISLYQSALEVRAQFFRLLESEVPVVGDQNDTLFIKIYADRTAYRDYNDLLFGVNYPNSGGVYIEPYSTFYTYERTAEESAYSLEDLFKHEYTHYLQGRYLVEGDWGQSAPYENSRLVWFEEGMAQFFAGATRTEGVKALELIRSTITRDDVKDGLNKVLSSSYSTGDPDAYYIYGAMLWTYWYEKDRGRFQEMLQLIREGELETFDSIVDYYKGSQQEEDHFFDYIDSLVADDSSWIAQNTSRILPQNISFNALDGVKEEISRILPDLDIEHCQIEMSEEPRQFRISGNVLIGGRPINNTQSAITLNNKLDAMLVQLETSELNNFDYATAFYDDPFTGSGTSTVGAEFHIYGPINDVCDPVPTEDFTSESLNNRVRLHVPEYLDLQHQFRYRIIGSNQWLEILANAVSPDVIFNIDPDATYEFQMRQECAPDIWSEYSESKYFMLCPDDRTLSGVVSSDESYQAAYNLTSGQNISTGASVLYRASNEIGFSNNFTIQQGGALTVNMENCQDPN